MGLEILEVKCLFPAEMALLAPVAALRLPLALAPRLEATCACLLALPHPTLELRVRWPSWEVAAKVVPVVVCALLLVKVCWAETSLCAVALEVLVQAARCQWLRLTVVLETVVQCVCIRVLSQLASVGRWISAAVRRPLVLRAT